MLSDINAELQKAAEKMTENGIKPGSFKWILTNIQIAKKLGVKVMPLTIKEWVAYVMFKLFNS